jgi:O-Antigen ligase
MNHQKKRFTLHKIMFVLLLLSPFIFKSVESIFLIIFLFLGIAIITCRLKFSKSFINILLPLLLIFFICFFSSFFGSFKTADFTKDFFYILKPIAQITLGYLLIKHIEDRNFIFISVIYVGTFLALIHILPILINYKILISKDINVLRGMYGRDNFLEIIALLFLLINYRLSSINIRYKKIILFILFTSFVLYFSRTMFVIIILLGLSFFGYTRITKKGVFYFSTFLILIAGLYVYLFSIEIERDDQRALSKFMYKMKIAPAEIFLTKIDINNKAELWDHWRGYEALKAIESLNNAGLSSWIFGRGFGSTVDLGLKAPLDDEGHGMQFISLLHNAYMFILYKSGIIGLGMFLILILILYHRPIIPNHYQLNRINNIIIGFGFFYLFSTLVISGIYNPRDNLALILGGIIFLRDNQIKLEFEDSNNRD